jgi:hypothetical protein
MKLFEHQDFEQAILGAEKYFSHRRLRPAVIEKDYYVTEALRIMAATAPDKITFKGGTSLPSGAELGSAIFGTWTCSPQLPESSLLHVLLRSPVSVSGFSVECGHPIGSRQN